MAAKPKRRDDLESKAEGYVVDTSYTYSYFEELMPINLKFLAALKGYKTPDINSEFTYLDLGCGHAVTLCLAAAVNPKGKFYGVDLMPEHIDYANTLVSNGEIKNIELIESSFEDLTLSDLPEFDFIVAHGLVSWVSESVLDQVRSIVDKKLKKGGIFYVSYNAMPGWAAKMPFFEIAHYFTQDDVPVGERMQEAIKLMQFMSREKAAFFMQNPGLHSELESIKKNNLNYLIHEYLNKNWNAFYFHEMNQYWEDIGLTYSGCFPFRNNYYEFVVPKNFHSFLEMQKSTEKIEEYIDFIRNTRFRKDLFVRDLKPETAFKKRMALFDDMYFTSLIGTDDYKNTVSLSGLTYQMKGQGYDVLRKMLSGKTYALKEILNFPEFKDHKPEDAFRLFRDFVLLRQALPVARPLEDDSGVDFKKLTFTSPLNAYLMQHLFPLDAQIPIACPATGTVVTSTHASAMILDGLVQTQWKEDEAVKIALKNAKEFTDKTIFRDKAYAEEVVGHLKSKFLHWLVKLGVLK